MVARSRKYVGFVPNSQELVMKNLVRISAFAILWRAGAAALGLFLAVPAAAQQELPVANPLTYVDLVELGMVSDVVLRAEIDDQATVSAERAPGLPPQKARLYLESVTQALLAGAGPIGESLAFLVDVDRDARGKAPKLKKQIFLLFARRVANRPGEIQLVSPKAMQPVDPMLEQRVRQVMTQLAEPDRPPLVTGVREVMSVAGNLVGESETQIFLETGDGAPVSLSILRRPGMAPQWGASWTDIVDQSASPPAPDTLRWYALACHLPAELPENAFLQRAREARARAREDYAIVRNEIGACRRSN